MTKREFLQKSGLLGLASLLPFHSPLLAATPPSCVLIPSETTGPFPLDLTENSFYFRQDIREDRTGVEHRLKLKIIGADNCQPMQNVRVNIWHCDKDGLYSGYDTETGKTYLRGYQLTDAFGEAEFTTIFPGWYPGRICHIHFQVYVSTNYAAISQLTYPLDEKNAIYANYPDLYTKGADPKNFNNDNIFSDGYQYQLAILVPGADPDVYESYLEVTVQGEGVSGLGNIERQNALQFRLGQNFPNPFRDQTSIPFFLLHPGDVKIDLFDKSGRRVATLMEKNLPTGDHEMLLDLRALRLPADDYLYQLEVRNSHGVFRDCRIMTQLR